MWMSGAAEFPGNLISTKLSQSTLLVVTGELIAKLFCITMEAAKYIQLNLLEYPLEPSSQSHFIRIQLETD